MKQEMLHNIPDYVLSVYKTFVESGFEIFFVGGCVRDLLLERKVKDWDFTTSASPEEILQLFPDGFYDNTFGTVGIAIQKIIQSPSPLEGEGGGEGVKSNPGVIEITTYRTEQGYTDNRHPGSVNWGKSIEEDLQRRDFTINAIAFKLKTDDFQLETNDQRLKTELIDPFHGQIDIENKTIRAVGDPNQRFKEDALRLMRAVRLATQLSFTIDGATLAAITMDATQLQHISKERVRDEFMKILASDFPYDGVMLLKNTQLLNYILPELLEGVGISQTRPGRHHTTDVFTHNVMSLKNCPATDPIVRFATLIHDVGKPRVQSTDQNGLVIFYNHEVAGARMAREICDRLRFSRKEKEKVVNLIRWHMFTVDEHITDSAVRRFIRRIGVENVQDMMDLRIGDRLGGGTQTAESWRLKLFKKRIEEQLAPLPFSINDLAIDGNDIMQALQMKPSRKIGELLQKLFEEVDEDLSKNTKEYLLQRVTALGNENK